MITFINVNTNEGIEVFPLSLLMEYKKGEVINIKGKDYEYFKREFIYNRDPEGKSILVVMVYVISLSS